MAIHLSGPDPYLSGPPRNYPADRPLLMKLRVKPSSGGHLQVFYYAPTRGTDEEHSIRAAVKPGVWQEPHRALAAAGSRGSPADRPSRYAGGLSDRLDPVQTKAGRDAPAWPRPTVPRVDAKGPMIQNGQLTLRQNPDELGGFIISVNGRPFATGHNRPMIGYNSPEGSSVRWIDVAKAAKIECGPAPGYRASP